jgi:hypothetical protein
MQNQSAIRASEIPHRGIKKSRAENQRAGASPPPVLAPDSRPSILD